MWENDKSLKLSIRSQFIWAAFNNSLFFIKKQWPLARSLKIFQTKRGGEEWPIAPLLYTPLPIPVKVFVLPRINKDTETSLPFRPVVSSVGTPE